MNCKNLKIRTRKGIKYGYCTKYKKEVPIFCKENCIEYKQYSPIKKRTSKLAKAEKERYSIITSDLSRCIMCGKPRETLHEVFFGAFRQRSIQYGIIIPLCANCHREVHLSKKLQEYWHIVAQERFNEVYPHIDFMEIFKRNYLK